MIGCTRPLVRIEFGELGELVVAEILARIELARLQLRRSAPCAARPRRADGADLHRRLADQRGEPAAEPALLQGRVHGVLLSPSLRHARVRRYMRPRLLALALDDLGGELDVGLAAGAVVVVEQDRLAVRGRLGDAHVARDHGLVDLGPEEGAHVRRDLLRQRRARVVHGQHDALDLEARIERGADLVDGLLELRDAFQREELALHRHQHGVRRRPWR